MKVLSISGKTYTKEYIVNRNENNQVDIQDVTKEGGLWKVSFTYQAKPYEKELSDFLMTTINKGIYVNNLSKIEKCYVEMADQNSASVNTRLSASNNSPLLIFVHHFLDRYYKKDKTYNWCLEGDSLYVGSWYYNQGDWEFGLQQYKYDVDANGRYTFYYRYIFNYDDPAPIKQILDSWAKKDYTREKLNTEFAVIEATQLSNAFDDIYLRDKEYKDAVKVRIKGEFNKFIAQYR